MCPIVKLPPPSENIGGMTPLHRGTSTPFEHYGPPGLVVFLVALPLCVGIALASGAPLFSGVIAGIVGGIIVSALSGSQISVSGPAAGLVVIAASSIQGLGSYKVFLTAVVLAGVLQLGFAALRAGSLADYVPNCVVKGMIAAIGIVIILKQIPHALGSDLDFEGDLGFFGAGNRNTITDLVNSFSTASSGPVIIAVLSLVILALWDRIPRGRSFLKYLPGPIVVVLIAVAVNQAFALFTPHLQIRDQEHLVAFPVAQTASAFFAQFQSPDWTQLGNQAVWLSATTIAVVASLESLLSLEAADRLDPDRRSSPPNRELFAQGTGNIVSGMLGGLPVASVILRTSANVYAGGRSWLSSFTHGILLFLSVLAIPSIINLIPLASLAAILIMIGYKLTTIGLYREMFRGGHTQFLPFIITLVAVAFTNLLVGVAIGLSVGILFVVRANHHRAITVVSHDRFRLIRFNKDATFLNKSELRTKLRDVPENTHLIVDGTKALYIDRDIIEAVDDFEKSAAQKKIVVEYKHFESAETNR